MASIIEFLFINATYLIMTGNSLELKIRLINWKLLIIGRVMTSLIVITLEIGRSAGKEPNFVMLEYGSPSTTARVWA